LAAGVAGGIHAGFSLYWAIGGSWLLDTVGEGALELQRMHPWGAAALLVVVGAIKAAGAVLPLVVEWGSGVRLRRVVRFISWIGGSFLVVYGSVYATLSTAVLTGVITLSGSVDRRGLLGHAMLWDPLFAVWGATLVVGLWLTRTPRESVSAGEPAPQSVPQRRAADAQEHRR
jgi:hypothetical protein